MRGPDYAYLESLTTESSTYRNPSFNFGKTSISMFTEPTTTFLNTPYMKSTRQICLDISAGKDLVDLLAPNVSFAIMLLTIKRMLKCDIYALSFECILE